MFVFTKTRIFASKRLMTRVMTRLRIAGLPLCVGLMLAGCARRAEQPPPAPVSYQPEMKQAPPTPIAEKKQELGEQSWDPQWDKIVEEALSPEMLSGRVAREVRSSCPRFATMSDGDKRAFWAYLFQALAGAEAGLKPTTDVRHTEPEVAVVDTVTKRMVRSEGLLQLTYMDATRYGCDFDWDKDKVLPEHDPAKTILQPRNNLTCGVKILENQIVTQRRPLLTSLSYWVTLRPDRPSYQVFAKQMTNVPAACRQGMPPQGRVKGRRVSRPPQGEVATQSSLATN
jgi:hypothetical protein